MLKTKLNKLFTIKIFIVYKQTKKRYKYSGTQRTWKELTLGLFEKYEVIIYFVTLLNVYYEYIFYIIGIV